MINDEDKTKIISYKKKKKCEKYRKKRDIGE